MARLMCVANGNNTDAATWAVIDSTSFLESETSQSIALPQSTYPTTYTQFTPGAITIDGIAVRVSTRVGTTGTVTFGLYNHTLGAIVAATEVTLNMTDVVDGVAASQDGGWLFVKFAPVLLLAANNYSVVGKTSSASQLNLYGASTTNPSRILRTTTTQAPVAGDDRFIMGEWTAAATMTTRTVTLNDTGAAVDYGSASTSQVTPALSISNGGIVLAGTTAATTYVQKISGNVVVYNGGILRIATSGSRMPTDSSFTWTFDCGANVDFGIDVRRKGEYTAYGESKTRWTLLTGDEAAAQTVIGVVDTTGWKIGDTLVFAPTGTTTTQGETKVIQTVDSGVQVTLTAGLTNAHTGTGDVIGEVGNLTSNISILGISNTVGTFICFRESSLGVLDNITVQYYGGSTSNKNGVEIQHISTSTNSGTLINCAFRDGVAASNIGLSASGGSSNGAFFYMQNCVVFSTANITTMVIARGGNTGTPTFDVSNNLIIEPAGSGTCFNMALVTGVGGTCTNNRISGGTTGVSFSTSFVQDTVSNISGFKVHTNTTGMSSSSTQNKTVTNCDFISNSTGVSSHVGVSNFVSCNFLGNTSSGSSLVLVTTALSTFTSCVFRGRTSFNQPSGIQMSSIYGAIGKAVFNICSFGTTIAHTSGDVNWLSLNQTSLIFNSCTFASATEFPATVYTVIEENGSIQIQRKDDTDGNHVMYVKQAIITPDTIIYRTASPSIRITPKSATIPCSNKLASFKAFVNSGQTCTPTVYVRESVVGDGTDYNGNRVKLYVKANYNAGITTDTLLDTATISSEGAWEALTGVTASVTDDCILEFYCILDGNLGWCNFDDWSYTTA